MHSTPLETRHTVIMAGQGLWALTYGVWAACHGYALAFWVLPEAHGRSGMLILHAACLLLAGVCIAAGGAGTVIHLLAGRRVSRPPMAAVVLGALLMAPSLAGWWWHNAHRAKEIIEEGSLTQEFWVITSAPMLLTLFACDLLETAGNWKVHLSERSAPSVISAFVARHARAIVLAAGVLGVWTAGIALRSIGPDLGDPSLELYVRQLQRRGGSESAYLEWAAENGERFPLALYRSSLRIRTREPWYPHSLTQTGTGVHTGSVWLAALLCAPDASAGTPAADRALQLALAHLADLPIAEREALGKLVTESFVSSAQLPTLYSVLEGCGLTRGSLGAGPSHALAAAPAHVEATEDEDVWEIVVHQYDAGTHILAEFGSDDVFEHCVRPRLYDAVRWGTWHDVHPLLPAIRSAGSRMPELVPLLCTLGRKSLARERAAEAATAGVPIAVSSWDYPEAWVPPVLPNLLPVLISAAPADPDVFRLVRRAAVSEGVGTRGAIADALADPGVSDWRTRQLLREFARDEREVVRNRAALTRLRRWGLAACGQEELRALLADYSCRATALQTLHAGETSLPPWVAEALRLNDCAAAWPHRDRILSMELIRRSEARR